MEKLNLFDIPRFYQLIQEDIDRFAYDTHGYNSGWYVYGVLGSDDGEDDFYNKFPEATKAVTTVANREGVVTREMYQLFIEEEYVDDVQKHVEELCNQHKVQS